MGVSERTSTISSVISVICIVIYILAIAFGAVQIIETIGKHRKTAENEFHDLSDRATSSAVILGFMSEPYRVTIQDFLDNSKTLQGIIITGSNGEYAFERQDGNTIVWAGDSPRFKPGKIFNKEPFILPLRIDGQRNVNIQAVYSTIDYHIFLVVLRNTLIIILAALFMAFITLMAELALKSRGSRYRSGASAGDEKPEAAKNPSHARAVFTVPEIPQPAPEPADESTQGLYTPEGNVGWESYTHDRLSSELHRCASFEQDLVFLVMEFRGTEKTEPAFYRRFTDEAVSFFSMRDLIFEKGESGISVIIPNMDLEHGIAKSEEFRSRIKAGRAEYFPGQKEAPPELCIGLSSRSGRLIEADRLMLEASRALDKAVADPASPVIAFKSDPEKYREFVLKTSAVPPGGTS